MAYNLEIWYSEEEEGTYLLWDTLPEANIGDYFESVFAPVSAGQTVFFKARRIELDGEGSPIGAYSSWSNIVELTALTPEEGFLRPMRDPAMGLDSVVGFGLQPTSISGTLQAPDRAVQVTNILEYTRGRVRVENTKYRSRSLGIGTSRSRKSAAGPSNFPGGYDVELTPVVIAKLLTFLFGPPTTATIAEVTGPPLVELHYKHTWKNNKDHMRATFIQQIEQNYRAFPGCTAGGLDFGVDKEGDTFITASLALQALNGLMYALNASVGISSAALDPDDAFTPLDGVCIINSADSPECHDVTASINRNPRSKRVLDRLRGAQRHYPGIADISMACTFYFSSRDMVDLYYGQAIGKALPYGITKDIKTLDVILALMTEPNSDGYAFEFGVHMPQASMDVADEPVEGSDEIMQTVTFTPDHDITTGADVEFYVVNGMTNAEVIAVGSLLTPVPANKVTSYTVG